MHCNLIDDKLHGTVAAYLRFGQIFGYHFTKNWSSTDWYHWKV